MISIIICSRKSSIDSELAANIAATVGSDHELLIIDNSQNNYSIFQAYNKGIEQSKSNILCFIHDDILFHSNDWGKKIIEIFNADTKIGLIGVAGSKAKTKAPSGWWNSPHELKQVNIIQHIETGEIERWEYGLHDTLLTEVVAIDGVFMAARKDKAISFDASLAGFHNYDLNISLEYKTKGYKVVVTKEILIEHFSSGNINKAWYQATQKFHDKYGHFFPLVTNDLNEEFDLKKQEFENGMKFIYDSLNFGFNFNIVKNWFRLVAMNPADKTNKKIFKRLIKNTVKNNK
jgi:glycosyltransferase involved in cell wall biosynthesis